MSAVPAQPKTAPGQASSRTRTRAFVAGASVLFVSALGLWAAISMLKIYVKKLPIEVELKCPSLPAETEHWRQEGADRLMPEATLETLGTHNYVDRLYVERTPGDAKAPRMVALHTAYYTGSVDTVPHVPERCMVAAGLSIVDAPSVHPIVLNRDGWVEDLPASSDTRAALGAAATPIYTARLGPGSKAPGNRVRLPRGIENLDLRVSKYADKHGNTTYAGYFFIANGGLTSSAQNVRLLAFDLHSDYAYYMKVQFSSSAVSGPEELAKLAGDLLDDLLPDVMLCVPDWTEVIRGDYPPDNPRKAGVKAAPPRLAPTP